jgi:uncharacterized protein (TIGR00297 family)
MDQAVIVIALRLLVGLFFSAAIGALAYRRKSLSRSGILGAILTGTLIFGFGGIAAGLLLMVFFVTSSALSHYKATRKQTVSELFDKDGQRDLGQALANGGVAALCAVWGGLALLGGNAAQTVTLCFAALVGALAAANADTWATELGVLSRTPPRLITRLSQVVAPGTSGGITRAGTLAAAAGAGLIGLANLVLQQVSSVLFATGHTSWLFLYNARMPSFGQAVLILVAALLGGLCGALIDSLLGATLQAMYYSDQRAKSTEKKFERDGAPNRRLRGWVWMNNDWVNCISTVCGAGISVAVTATLYLRFGA